MKISLTAAASAAMLMAALPAEAQIAGASVAAPAANSGACELHVWPTENYLGMNSGLLSGLGPIGAVADIDAHKGRVQTVKDLMREYLGPEIQLQELEKAGLMEKLGLKGYRLIVEEPTPFNEDLKTNPALKEKVKAMNAKLKSGQRLSTSTAACYAELTTNGIFYMKAMMYGSNLFTGWVYREYAGDTLKRKAMGAVKNPLENFPPKTADKVEAAKLELRDAFSKDFAEYVAKKVKS